MAMAAHVLDMPNQLEYHLGLIGSANSTSAMIEAVQLYLASWSMERIAKVQKIDAGWAPFDLNQRPLQVNSALDVRCIRDAIHCHCMALRESSVRPTPELVELEEFFSPPTRCSRAASELNRRGREKPSPCGRATRSCESEASGWRRPPHPANETMGAVQRKIGLNVGR